LPVTTREARQKEILDAAKKVFIRKGFCAATMEDIIAETSLSKGGFYYYYKSTVDILHDLMREGMAYRIAKMNEFMNNYSATMDKQALAEMLVDKMLDESELMSVYVAYLQAIKNNPELKELFNVLVDETLYSAYGGDIKGVRLGDFKYYITDLILFFVFGGVIVSLPLSLCLDWSTLNVLFSKSNLLLVSASNSPIRKPHQYKISKAKYD
jgi:AcrR family transcriptional regulator